LTDVVYDRAALLGKLKLVQPAIAKPAVAAIAPIFENIWLTDYGLLASNDVIAMATPLDATATVGGVHGGKLIGLINNCDSEVVRLSPVNGHLRVHGGFKASLAVDHGDPPFVWPQINDRRMQPIMVDGELAAALKLALAIADPTSSSAQARGVTLQRDHSGLTIWSSDRSSLLCVSFPHSAIDVAQSVTMTIPFVEQVIRLAPGMLWLENNFTLFESDEAGLWGRVLYDKTPLDYAGVLASRRPSELSELPEGFDKAIIRAGLMAAPVATRVPVRLTIANSYMALDASSASGDLFDTLPFDHPPLSVRFDQKLVMRILGKGFTHLGVTSRGLLFSGEAYSYLIASHDN
jgi:hypothetical protein